MSNYTKSTNFAAKDSLPSGNAGKVVKGTEINTEFDNIATAIATKADLNSPTLVTPNLGTPSAAVLTNATGLPLTTGVTGTLPVANGGTGATTFSAGALLKGAGTSAITTATAGTDYAPATSGTAILKGNGTGGFSNAAAGTDYAAATTGTSAQLLANNGSGGFSNVTVGSGLSLSSGTLSTTGGASISAGDSNVTVSDTGSNGTVTVQTDGSERMRITSGGNLLVGTTTNNASGGVIQVSNGITFPATQSASSDANTLDDYEEGTWTPANPDITYTTAVGTYTKIGRLVQWQAYVLYPSTANTSPARITGLPFSVQNSENARGGSAITASTYGSAFYGLPVNNGSIVYFYDLSASSLTNANLSGKAIWAGGTYITS